MEYVIEKYDETKDAHVCVNAENGTHITLDLFTDATIELTQQQQTLYSSIITKEQRCAFMRSFIGFTIKVQDIVAYVPLYFAKQVKISKNLKAA